MFVAGSPGRQTQGPPWDYPRRLFDGWGPVCSKQAEINRRYSSNDIPGSSERQERSSRRRPSGSTSNSGRTRESKRDSGGGGGGVDKDVDRWKNLGSPGGAAKIFERKLAASAQKRYTPEKEGAKRREKEDVFSLTPTSSTPTMSTQKKAQDGEGEEGTRGNAWQEAFNRWVVLEAETLKEARKTDQLAFLELEAIKVCTAFNSYVFGSQGCYCKSR